ncbi:MAG: hypothetical protein HN576_16325 [Bacteriovoracaceae bacterium]|jgi:hypothetical protein|nr:hypothetical protein [Bacteriovoracaceae bacterium]
MKHLLIILIGLSLTSTAFARGGGKHNKRVNRQKHQTKRIGQGVRSGELSKGETKRLVKGQKKIKKFKKDARSDGELTLEERAQMEKMQNKQSKIIYRTKHNDKSRRDGGTEKSESDLE